MGLLQSLPLSLGALAMTSAVVCAGSVLQVSTGVGLGLVAGPILLLSLPGQSAIFVAVVLNLLLSLALLPQERGEICWRPLRLLVIGTVIGLPLGWLVLRQIDTTTLKILSGLVVLFAAVQLMRRRPAHAGGGTSGRALMLMGGGFSGFMNGCLAIPGPVAMWALMHENIAPTAVRATLRALFTFSYAAALTAHIGFGGQTQSGWSTVAALLPALAIGIVMGAVVKRRISGMVLYAALRLILLAMAISLLWKGISDVIT